MPVSTARPYQVMYFHGIKPRYVELSTADTTESAHGFQVLALGGGEGLGAAVEHQVTCFQSFLLMIKLIKASLTPNSFASFWQVILPEACLALISTTFSPDNFAVWRG